MRWLAVDNDAKEKANDKREGAAEDYDSVFLVPCFCARHCSTGMWKCDCVCLCMRRLLSSIYMEMCEGENPHFIRFKALWWNSPLRARLTLFTGKQSTSPHRSIQKVTAAWSWVCKCTLDTRRLTCSYCMQQSRSLDGDAWERQSIPERQKWSLWQKWTHNKSNKTRGFMQQEGKTNTVPQVSTPCLTVFWFFTKCRPILKRYFYKRSILHTFVTQWKKASWVCCIHASIRKYS